MMQQIDLHANDSVLLVLQKNNITIDLIKKNLRMIVLLIHLVFHVIL
jgi:hypothetical protein